ncbi:CAP domain-containing protein [Mesorhizobium sp.]|uniref:CAP domain-containing protein n=1 Tax=Mesorhizobium sp. TaxID=1871066 RepID=UPI000FE7FC4D|nr:CAP domain-containing protein [Mesorhizobium sp.]RWI13893.1 MAG: CAP domain-containing protein [Mesorhizobium sp.]RWK46410.1 MAG: CAP domain-containing protein [Mesorhizobium sp.]RWK92946.1 MAG: CAP domain-containing protein [Mesorhizobium sp.]TIP96066.1 MAG: CAP domain-containing protein [Mesorhizobium sp.]TIQ26924.1 MAG: CAP domain-containing protein [Mesorhizobium sp.]
MPQHSAHEQYLLELINAARAKAGVQPLAFDNDLSEAAEGHSRWMLATDTFSHTGSGGSSPTQRMKAAGYTLAGSWATGENIAWATTRSPTGYNDEIQLLHNNLMNSSGHRANILNGNFREVGLGFEVGDYRGRSSGFVTENFAKTGSDLFLTGVAIDDKDGDKFYDPGEGLSGLTITAKSSTGTTFTTKTMAAGGYDLALKPGTYTVTFSGAGIEASTRTVSVGSKNVKLDLVDPKQGAVAAVQDEAAAASDPAPQQDPTPTAQAEPAPTTPPVSGQPDSGQPDSGSQWLANFFSKHGANFRSDQTLAEHEEAEGTPGTAKESGAQVALDGDNIVFPQLANARGQLDDAIEQVRDDASTALATAGDSRPAFDWAEYAHTQAGDADALAAKLIEQLSAHNNSMIADQAA